MKNSRIFLSAVALLIGSSAFAADLSAPDIYSAAKSYAAAPADPIFAANNQFAIQFVTTSFDYREHNAGVLFDTESGWVPGVGAEITVMQTFIVPNFYFDAAVSYLDGQTDYVGGPIDGSAPFGSIVAKSGAQVLDLDFRVGKGFAISSSFMATPFVGTGFHQWDRGVNQGETYSHGYVGGGMLLQWAATNKLVVSANGVVGTTFASFIDVAGPLGFSGDLGDSLIWKAGGGIDYAVTDHWHASAKVELTEFSYGRSDDHSVSALCNSIAASTCGWRVWEPHSDTQLITVRAGIGYSWGSGYVPLK